MLSLISATLLAASAYVLFERDASTSDRLAGAGAAMLFGWGLLSSLARVLDRRPVITIDEWGIRDRRMKIAAPWNAIRGVAIWNQEFDAAHATWIALNVRDTEKVRTLNPLWARLRHLTLERGGRPPVALNLLGLASPTEEVLAAIARYRPDLKPT